MWVEININFKFIHPYIKVKCVSPFTIQIYFKMGFLVWSSICVIYLGLGRKGVPLLSDASYQKTQKSSDTELNKTLFYGPAGRQIIKFMTFCTATPKV